MNALPKGRPAGNVQISADIDVSTLSFQQLSDLRDALKTMTEVIAGLVSQPRFERQKERRVLNDAGVFLDGIGHMVDVVDVAIFSEAKKRAATTDEDKALKFGIIAARYVDGAEDPGDVLAEIAHVVAGLGRGEPS